MKTRVFLSISCAFVWLFNLSCKNVQLLGDQQLESRELTFAALRMDGDLRKTRELVQMFANYCREIYSQQKKLQQGYWRATYQSTANGILYQASNHGGSAFLSTGIAPAPRARKKARFTEFLDPLMIAATKTLPEIGQMYFNDRESIARIYPYFDVVNLFDPGTDVRNFNFYYLADEKHNPQKRAIWVTDPYVDPAGRGWLISSIAPVYLGGELQGVAGIDITLHTLTERYLADPEKLLVLVDQKGLVVATEDKAAKILQLPPLLEHKYIETIKSNTFRSEEFNLLQSPNRVIRAAAWKIMKEKQKNADVTINNHKYRIFSAPIEELDWFLWQIVPK